MDEELKKALIGSIAKPMLQEYMQPAANPFVDVGTMIMQTPIQQSNNPWGNIAASFTQGVLGGAARGYGKQQQQQELAQKRAALAQYAQGGEAPANSGLGIFENFASRFEQDRQAKAAKEREERALGIKSDAAATVESDVLYAPLKDKMAANRARKLKSVDESFQIRKEGRDEQRDIAAEYRSDQRAYDLYKKKKEYEAENSDLDLDAEAKKQLVNIKTRSDMLGKITQLHDQLVAGKPVSFGPLTSQMREEIEKAKEENPDGFWSSTWRGINSSFSGGRRISEAAKYDRFADTVAVYLVKDISGVAVREEEFNRIRKALGYASTRNELVHEGVGSVLAEMAAKEKAIYDVYGGADRVSKTKGTQNGAPTPEQIREMLAD